MVYIGINRATKAEAPKRGQTMSAKIVRAGFSLSLANSIWFP